MDTKQCKECFKDVDVKATKCPYCQAHQGTFVRFWHSPIGPFVPAIVFFLGFFVFFKGIVFSDPIYDVDNTLELSQSEFHFVDSDCGTKVTLIGSIKNKSDLALRNPTFDVVYYDAEKRIVDAISHQSYGLVLPPRSAKTFKVSEIASAEKSLYISSKVSVARVEKDNWL